MDGSHAMMLDGISCRIDRFGAPTGTHAPLVVMPYAGDVSDTMAGQHERLDPMIASGELAAHVLVTFDVANWNDDLSPWAAPTIGRGQEAFGGHADRTLAWIVERLLPDVAARVPAVRDGKRGLLGYSMAGLFAVWAMTRTDAFAAYASCSGSLWFEGLGDYLEGHAPKGPCAVYLSLGEREERARNRWFARVGEQTRRAHAACRASPMCADAALVWHPGGHLGAVGERLAAARIWMDRWIA